MSQVAGVKLEKDSKGRIVKAFIDVRKRPETIDFLQQIGALEKPKYSNIEEFLEGTITGEQLEEYVVTRMREKYGK